MVAALGVRRSQGTRLCLSGAKILAVTARGCVLAPLAYSGLFTTTEEGAEIPGREGLQISLVKWSLWHLGYSCAHLIRAKRAWSSLAKKALSLRSWQLSHLTHKMEGGGTSIGLQFAHQSFIKPPVSRRDDWHTDETIDRRSVLCLSESQFVLCIKSLGKKPTSSPSPLLVQHILSFLPPSQNKEVWTFENHIEISFPFFFLSFSTVPTTCSSFFHNATGVMQHGEVCATEWWSILFILKWRSSCGRCRGERNNKH